MNGPTVFGHLHPTAVQVLVRFFGNLALVTVFTVLGVRLGPGLGLGAPDIGRIPARNLGAWTSFMASLPLAVGLGLVTIAWFAAVATALGHLGFVRAEFNEPVWVAELEASVLYRRPL